MRDRAASARAVALATVLLAGAAHGQPPSSALEADEASLCIHTAAGPVAVQAEVASTFTARSIGLSGRAGLAPSAGMLFLYRRLRPADSGFWMYRTRIPLDIAFIGPDGDIRAIHHMTPCPGDDAARCPVYLAGVDYQAALEVNAGFFASHGIALGDQVAVADAPCAP